MSERTIPILCVKRTDSSIHWDLRDDGNRCLCLTCRNNISETRRDEGSCLEYSVKTGVLYLNPHIDKRKQITFCTRIEITGLG